ncbi:MAG: response regulator [Planctomycetota bacterium]|nr:response regulator [Planctomycetota bacterium]
MGPIEPPRGAVDLTDAFLALAQTSSDGVVILDADRRIAFVNDVAAQRLDGSPQELLGGAFVYPFTLDATEELTLHGVDAEAVPVELSARKTMWQGQPAALLVLRDMTSRREALRLGRRMERQLRGTHRREAIGSLAAGLAHDFNNFLTVSLGRSELLLRRLDDDEELARHVRLIHMGAKHHSVLTRQFLGMVGRDTGKAEDLDVEGTLGGIAPVLSAALGDAIEVELEVAPNVGNVRIAPGRLEQIFVNLALNARDAMPKGGRLVIRAAVEELEEGCEAHPFELPAGRYVRFEVADDGNGMSEHVLQHAFETFFTTKAPREGGGLGLSVVHGLIEESGGGIWIDSAQGEGTTIGFFLPGVRGLGRREAVPVPTAAVESRGVILLVEDEPDVRVLVREILEMCSYQVLEAVDGRDAEQVLETHAGSLELVLTDVVMPRKSGAALARSLRQSNPDLPILYMSGYTRRDIYRRGLIPDGAPYIQKPFPPSDLLAAVERITA